MVPADIDIAAIERDLADDGVALGSIGEQYPGLITDSRELVEYAQNTDFGNLCLVQVEPAPSFIADHRDIAETILRDTDCTTVIARSLTGGDIVSENFSRAAIEANQFDLLGNPDYVGSARVFVDQVHGHTTSWQLISLLAAAVIVTAFVITLATTFQRREATVARVRAESAITS
ncbi:DUF6676 family protein [Corynebacterium choanae]|uniref:1-deoxy-D-xylulose-5-phosphate synthase n=1 Tax=Corynebacterium choanae TaxID=1862358 RepID=A0A3G6JBS9_9CORY|nr:DUF6676 family protein [Corynebacterium choanae]AZA13604.1 hypothetical protein CCHOA_06025 [Corynebacterium choanae]